MEHFKDLEIPMKEIAPNTFHKENCIGGGGFGLVYKGKLSRFKERGMVAFKKLDRIYGQGETEFFKEIEMLSQYKHENIITLFGYCMEERNLILVYEYASKGSLDSRLDSPHLTWNLRLKICLQAAKGLRYLHDPNKARVRVIHRDIKSANILLDDEWNAKVSDFGLSKISPENANLVTYASGTSGYLDPQYYKTYTLTEKSDVYSFGVTLFEVLCGRLCYDVAGHNDVLVYVHKWMRCYEQKILEDIIFKGLDMKQIDPITIQLFSDIAYKCLNKSREERPTMAEVVSQLDVALQAQEHYEVFLEHPLAKEYEEILRTANPPVIYRSIEELKQCLSQWVLLNGGHTWLVLKDMGAHHLLISVNECLIFPGPNRDYNDEDISESARFKGTCLKTPLMNFKLHVRYTPHLTPDVTYGLNLLIRCSDGANISENVGVLYQLDREKNISIMKSSDTGDDNWWVVELGQFTNRKESVIHFKIQFDDWGLSSWMYIEGIEFRPLKKVEISPVEVASKEKLRTMEPHLSYSYTEELKVPLSKGILLREGKMWLSVNEKGEHHLMMPIKEYLTGDYNYEFSEIKKSRLKVDCCRTRFKEFKLHVTTPLFLSPGVSYMLNLVIHNSEREKIKQRNIGVRYNILGETKISALQFEDNRESEWFVVPLYQFTGYKDNILDLEIMFKDYGLAGDSYIEGIEFRPLEEVGSVAVEANEEIVRATTSPLFCKFTEEVKVLFSKGILLEEGKLWLSLNDKGEHHVAISMKAFSGLDEFSEIENSRFAVGCYMIKHFKDFNLHVTNPLFLSPNVTYRLNLVFHCSEREKKKHQYVGVKYKIEGETKISILEYEDKREGNWLVAELYQYTSYKDTTLDLEILFEDCGLADDFYIEGIEFLPLEKAERSVIEANEEIVTAAVSPLFNKFTEEVKVRLSQGIFLEEGKMWLSLNEKGEHHVAISIKAFYSLDEYSRIENSRFAVGCCMIKHFKEFKLRVTNPLFLSPNVIYGLNLVFHCSEREKKKQKYVGVKYILEGEIKFSVLEYEDKREGNWLVAELYQHTSYKHSTLDLEILFDDFGLAGDFYIEGIEFRPLGKVENALVEENKVTAAVSSLSKKFTEEVKVLLSQGILLDKGKMWLSLNGKEEHIAVISIQVYMIGDHHDGMFIMENSRVAAPCYKTRLMKFKLHVTKPLFLSPDVRYGLNLLIYYSEIEKIKECSIGIRYNIHGETKMSVLQFEDKELGNNLVAELYQFTNNKDSILDLEIVFEDCGLAGNFYIEGIEFQPLEKAESAVVVANEEVVRAAAPPMFYNFTKQPERLLSQWVLFNEGKTSVFLNDKGQTTERIEIGACLDGSSKLPFDYSSWPLYEYKDEFKASVRAEYLSPHVSYKLYIYFKFEFEEEAKEYSPLRYKIDGEETKVFIINKKQKMVENGLFAAQLYRFTSEGTSLHLDIMFEQRDTKLQVAVIHLTPSQVDLQLFEMYQKALKADPQFLLNRPNAELRQILSTGVHVNEYKTWFSLNEKAEHCEMISMKDCLIPYEGYNGRFKSHPLSKFPAGFFETNREVFKTHVKAQFLSPLVKYTIYLVFKSSSITKQAYLGLKYRLRGQTTTSAVYLANPREEDELHMADLFRFSSNGSTFDLEIDFDGQEESISIEGILFQPLEEVEDQPLKDSHSENWEERFPNDYEDILKLSKDRVRWTTKKELYSMFCRGLLLDKGDQWFTIDKNGKKCQMLCARASLVCNKWNSTWESSPQSRFGEVLAITADDKFKIWSRIAPQGVSPGTRYACYLVYGLPKDQSTFEAPLHVNIHNGHAQDAWFVYLSPPKSPVIGQNLDESSWNPLNRYKGNGIPQQRSDGWMEVKVWEFQPQDTKKSTHIHLKLTHLDKKDLNGLKVQGIELRPV